MYDFICRQVFQNFNNTTFYCRSSIVPKVGVVLTDGKSNSKTTTIKQASLAKDEGISMVSVGIGSKLYMDEIEGMASDPISKNVILTDFDALVTAINHLANIICDGQSPKLTSNRTLYRVWVDDCKHNLLSSYYIT